MKTIKLSATAARNKFFELLNQVASGNRIIIEKDHKEIAVLSPKVTKTDWKGLLKTSREVRGILKNDDRNDNPLRKTSAADFLGNWDKDLHVNDK